MDQGNVKLGWNVPEKIKQGFVEYCDSIGVRYQDQCAGSLIVWEHLPSRTREVAVRASKGEECLDELKECLCTVDDAMMQQIVKEVCAANQAIQTAKTEEANAKKEHVS